MNVENIQQERSYHEFIQNFSSLSKEIKEDKNLPFLFNEAKDESIYNAVVGFYTAKFLIERGTNQKKDEVYEVLQKELDKTKEAAQKLGDKAKRKLEREVREKLKGYIEGGVKEDGVKIYGNHASITLEDNKKEFKISEFLNSDFCQKNGISGFSTLHSDGKSGMHGFVAEEGGRKIRHYVVTDGSYEMTLNWYVNGEKCTIKINIDKDGVDLIEPNGVTEQLKKQLEANKDVKIGSLFLHQIQFREKGKEQENEAQKNSQSSEAFIGSNSQNVSVQVHFGPQSNRRRQPYDSGIGKDFDDKINSQNKKTPPPPPLRTSSLPPKGNVVNEQTSAEPASHNQDNRQKDERYDSSTFTTFGYTASGQKETVAEEALQVKSAALAPPTQDVALKKVKGTFKSKDAKESGNTGDKPPLNDVASILEWRAEIEFLHSEDFDNEINSQEAKEKRERRQAARKESSEGRVYNLQSLFEGSSQNKKTPPPVPPRTNSLKKNVFDEQGENSSTKFVNQGQNKFSSNATDMAQKQFIENVLENIEKGSQYDPIRNWLKDKIEGKENNQNLDALEEKLSKKYSQGNIVEKRENDDSKPLSPTSIGGNTDVEQSDDTQLQKNSRKNGKEPEEEERNFQKISKALGEWKEKLRKVKRSDRAPLTEFTSKLDKETQKFPLRPVNQERMHEQTREHSLEDKLLQDSSTDIKTVAERENADTNLTIDKNSELSKLLARDEEQLKTGVIEAEREDTLVEHTNSHDRNRIALANRNRKLLWTEHVAKQQAKETKDILRCNSLDLI
jgi:hypothetical protein